MDGIITIKPGGFWAGVFQKSKMERATRMEGIVTIKPGKSLPFDFDRGGQDISGWTCTIEVKQFPDDVAAISRVITPTDGVWAGYLTATETAALGTGQWRILAQLSNTTTDEKEVIEKRFNIGVGWA